MAKKKTAVHIFYSWQSDSPKKTNLNAIRKALADACKRLEAGNPKLKLDAERYSAFAKSYDRGVTVPVCS